MEMWKCKKCGYLYNPEIGDSKSDIKGGTPFEKLPESWVCPRCQAGRDQFFKVER
jgi:rubredoxin